MVDRGWVRIVGIVVVLIVAGGLVPSVWAQPDSPAALRQRIAALESHVVGLEAQLVQLRAERDRLSDEVDRLRREIVASPGNGPVVDRGPRQLPASEADTAQASVPVSALSQEPLASPDALFIALLLDYRDEFANDPSDTSLPSEGAVEKWIAVSRATYDGPAAWMVRIDGLVHARKPGVSADQEENGRRMLATVLDTVTGEPISRPVMIDIPRRFDGRFPERMSAGEMLFAEMRLKFAARPVFEPGRVNAGPFDYPQFIGPYAGFGYDVDIVGLKFLTVDEVNAKTARPDGPVDR